MNIINPYMKYVYIILILALIAALIAFLKSLMKTVRNISDTAQGASSISVHIDQTNEKLSAIRESKDSYKFFLSLLAVFVIIKDTFKYAKSEKSLSKSFRKAFMRHTASLTKIHI